MCRAGALCGESAAEMRRSPIGRGGASLPKSWRRRVAVRRAMSPRRAALTRPLAAPRSRSAGAKGHASQSSSRLSARPDGVGRQLLTFAEARPGAGVRAAAVSAAASPSSASRRVAAHRSSRRSMAGAEHRRRHGEAAAATTAIDARKRSSAVFLCAPDDERRTGAEAASWTTPFHPLKSAASLRPRSRPIPYHSSLYSFPPSSRTTVLVSHPLPPCLLPDSPAPHHGDSHPERPDDGVDHRG